MDCCEEAVDLALSMILSMCLWISLSSNAVILADLLGWTDLMQNHGLVLLQVLAAAVD